MTIEIILINKEKIYFDNFTELLNYNKLENIEILVADHLCLTIIPNDISKLKNLNFNFLFIVFFK